mgnify:CR=1 FL=1
MDNFDLKKYLAEGKLLKEDDQLTKLFNLSKHADIRYGEDKLYKLAMAWERWNVDNDDKYDELVNPLFAAVELVQDQEPNEAKRHLRQFNKDVVKAMEFHTENKNPLKEFVGKELEDRNEEFYHLVPGMGKADTVEGEMLRAINKIVYRWYNDGDEYHIGYGTETAGPAHSFLVNSKNPKQSALKQIFSTGTDYEQTIKDALDLILDYIEGMAGNYTKNTLGDMLDYEAEFEDEEYDDEEEYDDWDEYDDDDDEDEY